MGFIGDTFFGMDDAKKAAQVQGQGFKDGEAVYQNAGNTASARFDPYANTGRQANTQLMALLNGDMSSFQQSPGYQFAIDEGRKMVDNSGAAAGMTFSGPQLKALMQQGQGMANQEYGQYFNRLLNLSNQGMNAAGNQGNIDMNTADGVASMKTGAAGARASGYMAKANMKSALTNNLLGSVADIATSYAGKPGGAG